MFERGFEKQESSEKLEGRTDNILGKGYKNMGGGARAQDTVWPKTGLPGEALEEWLD